LIEGRRRTPLACDIRLTVVSFYAAAKALSYDEAREEAAGGLLCMISHYRNGIIQTNKSEHTMSVAGATDHTYEERSGVQKDKPRPVLSECE
jgi:hypothetical protein